MDFWGSTLDLDVVLGSGFQVPGGRLRRVGSPGLAARSSPQWQVPDLAFPLTLKAALGQQQDILDDGAVAEVLVGGESEHGYGPPDVRRDSRRSRTPCGSNRASFCSRTDSAQALRSARYASTSERCPR